MGKFQDITGNKFNKLTVIKVLAHGKWLCKCDCGNQTIVQSRHLKNGHTKSCGCLFKEMLVKRNQTHNMTGTFTYLKWESMKRRCDTPGQKCYKNYGGRGISYCERWKSFENFYADMGECPEGLTLGRIENDGNYEPSNCEWTTITEQARNKRNTKLSKYKVRLLKRYIAFGLTFKKIAQLYNCSPSTIKAAYYGINWKSEMR